jgi:hypothetical protein
MRRFLDPVSLIISFLTVGSLVPRASDAHAQTAIPPYEVVPDGQQYQITLGEKERNIKQLSIFFVSTGNVSSAVEIRVEGPMGIRGTVRGGFLGSASPQDVLSASGRLDPIRTRLSMEKDAKDFGLTVNGSDARVGSAYVWYHLQKNACSGGRTDRYISEVILDLSSIDPSLYALTFSIRLGLKEFKFSRSMVASIKPSSDGKYRGEPILLMASVGYPEYVNIVRWAGNRIRSARRIPVVKYVSYKGYGLSLARLRSVLTGGRHTFELSNGGDLYGVCFNAVRQRQSVNGYPAPNG